MNTSKLKRLLLPSILLIVGFAAGWLSAITLGNRLPLDGDITAMFGPGRTANLATPQQLRSQFGVFWEVWNLVENEFYHEQPLDRTKMIRGAISGMLATLEDPYTFYQEPVTAQQTNEHMQGKLEGIGAYISAREGRAFISGVFKNSPALKAGLLADDEIIKINDILVSDLAKDKTDGELSTEVANNIRGPQGTDVTLTIKRGEAEPFQVTITRAEVIVSSVDGQMIDDIAYIKISEFKAPTTQEFDEMLRELLPQKPRAFILDLRNNPGGYLQNAQEVLGRFYSGTALYEDLVNGTTKELSTKGGGRDVQIADMPVIILVNEKSASASEIVAGALRDERPGVTIIGVKTFGKGSVQNIHNLSDGGSARITIARWLTPNKNVINKQGIEPDHNVPYSSEPQYSAPCLLDTKPAEGQSECADSQLRAALDYLNTGSIATP
jgi:carboxyl-terminal processing protease